MAQVPLRNTLCGAVPATQGSPSLPALPLQTKTVGLADLTSMPPASQPCSLPAKEIASALAPAVPLVPFLPLQMKTAGFADLTSTPPSAPPCSAPAEETPSAPAPSPPVSPAPPPSPS